MNNQFDKQSRAHTTSKIDELMRNQRIQEILLEPNDLFENLLVENDSDNNKNPHSDIEAKVETLLSLLNNFMLRHGVTQLAAPGSSAEPDEHINNTASKSIAEGFSPSEQFLLNAIDKLSNYIEVLQARETAKRTTPALAGPNSEVAGQDYPGTAATPNSMFAGFRVHSLSPNVPSDGRKQETKHEAKNTNDLGVYQKLAHAEVKMKRLISQISEMNIEYKCQKTQVEALEKFNESLNNQIKRLEQQLYDTQSQMHRQSKIGSGIFGTAGAERTPRQLILEERMRTKEHNMRSRDRMSSLQLQIQNMNQQQAKSSMDFNTGCQPGMNPMDPSHSNIMLSPKSTRTQPQLQNEPFKSVEVTEVGSAQASVQGYLHNP